MKLIISHVGFTGDLIYCLPMVTELKESLECELQLHIQTNVKSNLMFEHPNGNVRMTEAAAKFLLPLLEETGLFSSVTHGDEIPKPAEGAQVLDLSKAYHLNINYMAGSIESWPYNLVSMHLPQDFSRQIIKVKPNDVLKDKVIMLRSTRYNNEALDLSVLKPYADKFVFIGMENEYKEFEDRFFKIDYFKIKDALEFAEVAAGAKGILSNQNGIYSIVELMKLPRILMSSEFIKMNDRISFGPVNVIPQGGWFEVAAIQSKLMYAVENLLKF